MATDIHPEVSKKNRYYISKELYYELKHFCRQYSEWQKAYNTFAPSTTANYGEKTGSSELSRSTESVANILVYFKSKMDLVDSTLNETDPDIAKYLKLCVTEGYSYEFLKSTMDIPIGRDAFYDRYRKFFWLLARKR